ncbi:MAG: inorganic pyrophosphatase [Clostridia bacterium]|nr:inorganic pyrophosphatase [Clostridia bacterium]
MIGTRVAGTVDRPIGSIHPTHKDMVYPINYGYVDGLLGGDGEEQDVYILGPDRPMETFEGVVIGVYHRLNDNEDKWIVTPDGNPVSRETILASIAFQEQYYIGELYLSD